jgi:ubiquinone/menaquinone biosynthesis C-methylase UbiE
VTSTRVSNTYLTDRPAGSGARPHTIYDRADVYERIYRGRGKDYRMEAATVAGLVRERHPGGTDLLDVACGPGSHLVHFAEEFEHVEGLDLSESMIVFARDRLPAVPIHQGDLRGFDLGRGFDAVTCMFSSIAVVGDRAELDAALRTFARHLNPGGVAVVEPWWFPDTFRPGYVGGDVVEVEGRTIARVSHAVRVDGFSHSTIHYLVAESGAGVRHFEDQHVMPLFAREEYEEAFRGAGMEVGYHDLGNGGPGVFVGVLSGSEVAR